MHTFWQDLRYGARMLAKNPGFTWIAIVTLAVGIGATTAIFSVVNAVLLRPLPYPEADRLLTIEQQYPDGLAGAGEPKFLFWREQSRSFESMAAYSAFGGADGNLSGGNEAEYVRGLRVSVDFFRVLRVFPALGRGFTAEEDRPGGDRVAILSDGLFQRRFGGDKGLIGRTVLFNDRPILIVGVMPPGFRFGEDVGLFVPMQARPGANLDPNATVIGRLGPGVSLAQAQAELTSIAEKYRAASPQHMQKDESVHARLYQEIFVTDIRQYLWVLLGAVGFLLLIACANVANLQLARAASRRREIAVRKALGAGSGRITRQLLTEGVLLSFAGGAAGLLLAVWGTEVLLAVVPKGMLPEMAVVRVDWRVLLFALFAAVATGLLFGLAPAWQARNVDVNTSLKEQAGKGGTARGGLRGALVIVEVALAVVLLVGAGLLIRTFTNLLGVAPGFDPRNVMTCRIALNGERYDTTREAAAFYRDALARIRNLPGVEAAAVVNKLPLDWQFNMPVVFPSAPDVVHGTQFRMASPDYFRVMRIALRQGRDFTEADNAGAAPVAIVNEAFVKRYLDGDNGLAGQLSIGRGLNDPPRQVIGVVADAKQTGLDRPAEPTVFVPISQLPDRLMAVVRAFTSAHIVVRTTVAPLSLRDAVKGELARLDPGQPLSDFSTMEALAARSVAAPRFSMLLLGLFAGVGLLLAGVGIYGVMAYSVAQRTVEIGLRIALGARGVDVIRMILLGGLSMAFAGICAGLLGSLALTRLMESQLFGVTPTDPPTFLAIALLLAAVALLAAWLPARRAARVDPMTALREE